MLFVYSEVPYVEHFNWDFMWHVGQTCGGIYEQFTPAVVYTNMSVQCYMFVCVCVPACIHECVFDLSSARWVQQQ